MTRTYNLFYRVKGRPDAFLATLPLSGSALTADPRKAQRFTLPELASVLAHMDDHKLTFTTSKSNAELCIRVALED
jgi:hypothetical protein